MSVIASDVTDLRVGASHNMIFFRNAAKGCTNSYNVLKFPDHEQRMRYTLSQICMSQQKASRLIDFCKKLLAEHKTGEYAAGSVLIDEPELVDPYEKSKYAKFAKGEH